MSFFESILYGFISGFSEFIPASSQAHAYLMKYIFGVEGPVPLFDILAHLGMLLGLLFSCRTLFMRIKRDKIIMQRGRRRKEHRPLPSGIYDIRIVRTASIPMVMMLFCGGLFLRNKISLLSMTLLLIVNGVLLLVSDYVRQGNKEAQSVSALDAVFLGIFGGFSCFAGISRVGTNLSYSVCRGAGRQSGYDWALLISVPALFVTLFLDVIGIFSSGLGTINFLQIVFAFLTFLFSFLGSCSAIAFMKYLIVGVGLSGFAFYSWGTALFSFIIYLLT